MARIFVRRTLTGFAPADAESEDAWRQYKLGEIYRATVTKPRSYRHHKLCMALLNVTYQNQEIYANFKSFLDAVKIASGHVDHLQGLDGKQYVRPRSISYDELDEVEFTKVFRAMMTVCCKILHDIGADDLESEVSKYADEHYGAGY